MGVINVSTCILQSKILNVPYQIDARSIIEFKFEHGSTIGWARFDGIKFDCFLYKNDVKLMYTIDTIIENGGGLSHGGYFDNHNHFILSEVSITRHPRFKNEVIFNGLRNQ